ncbi:MAG: acetylglutamate kinase, partial [Alteromonas sp.]|nr:acetylglutamate kinase [Alteromonas sp.]
INDILNKKTGTQILPSALTNTPSKNADLPHTDFTKGNAGEVQ